MFGKKKDKKPREIRGYTPPKELTGFGYVMLFVVGVALLLYFVVNFSFGAFGKQAAGTPYTRLVDGQVVPDELSMLSSTLLYTFEDENGQLHEGQTSLLGNNEKIGETVVVYYFTAFPQWSMLSFRAGVSMTQFGCLLLGLLLVGSATEMLRKKRRERSAVPEPEPAASKSE